MHRIVAGGRGRWLVLGAVAVVLLAACGDDGDDASTAPVAPKQVFVLAGLNDQQDGNVVVTEFLPEAVSIAAGSTIEWRFAGLEPHSVTFLPPGQAAPTPGTPQAQALAGPSTPPATAYDGTSLVNSGLLATSATATPSFSLTFPRAGQFPFVCVIHPGMTGRVTVAVEGAPVDSQADINERADRELNMWLDEGRAAKKTLTDTAPKQVKDEAEGTTTWTYEMGATTEHTAVQAFAPHEGEVQPGDSVTFVNNTQAPHTATFASGGQVPQNPNDPTVAAPTGPPPLVVTPAGGPFNSGIVRPATPPNPPPEPERSFTFVLPEPGTYPYVCVFHDPSGMGGSIKVA